MHPNLSQTTAPFKGYAFEIGDSAVVGMMAKVYPGFVFDIATVCRKDSTEIDGEDRRYHSPVDVNCIRKHIFHTLKLHVSRALLLAVQAADADRVIVTHGTDTLIETAQYLSNKNGCGTLYSVSRDCEILI
jgi:hypothetical protein